MAVSKETLDKVGAFLDHKLASGKAPNEFQRYVELLCEYEEWRAGKQPNIFPYQGKPVVFDQAFGKVEYLKSPWKNHK